MQKKTRVPSYRKHKSSGQAIVTIDGKDFYLGPHDTEASLKEYDRLIGEWQANGRRLPSKDSNIPPITITELVAGYWQHVQAYYLKHGKPTSEQGATRSALRPLRRKYGDMLAGDFSSTELKAVRQDMIELGWCRSSVNRQVGRIRALFRWGAEEKLVEASVKHQLEAVRPLAKGRQDYHGAPEMPRVKPVADATVEAIRSFLSVGVWSMLMVQRLTAMRPGEVVILRGCDIDTSGRIWIYRPSSYKLEHLEDKERVVAIGPAAQELIRPYLKTDLQAYLFSPADAVDRLHTEQRRNRKTKVQPSQLKRSERARKRAERGQRQRAPQDRYTVNTYRRAIHRACDRAFPAPEPLGQREGETLKQWANRLTDEQRQELKAWQAAHRWSPNRLRHTAATAIRKQYGIEAARAVLGHSSATMTGVYAALDEAKSADIMRAIG